MTLPQLTTTALLAAVFACWVAAASGADNPRPNVLFLICDDLNCDLGCYGHPQVESPNIDRLAARGVRFEHAYCQYPLCGPSRASFMSGLYPDQTLIRQNAIGLRERLPDVVSLSQMFKNAGYFATRIGKIYHYDVPAHIGTGGHDDPYSWDHTIHPRGRDKDDEAQVVTLRPGQYGATLSWLAADGADAEQTDGIAATEAIEQLKKFSQSKRPFFLAVGLYRPHTPYVAPQAYFERYPLASIRVPNVPDGYLDTIPVPARRLLTSKKEQVDLPEETAQKAIQAYHASISFADAQLGRILNALEQTGLDENTIVLFTSDHGYHMGQHGHYQKRTLFEDATHVPLILAGPGVVAVCQSSDAPAEMVDFYPTLAELAGLKAPGHVAGVSLAPVLRDVASRPRRSAFTQLDGGYSIRTPRFRYTEWGDEGSRGAELYDHGKDPGEMNNLAGSGEYRDQQNELAGLLRARIAQARSKPQGIKQVGAPAGERKR